MKERRKKIKWASFWAGLLFIGVVFLLNGLFINIPLRIDLTQEKLYTLSPSTKKILSNLKDIVRIKVYFSSKLPPDLITLREQIKDLLDEYRAYSHGNILYEFVDPLKNPRLQGEVARLGIPPVQLNVFEKDKLEVIKGYLGMAFYYGDKTEVIPVVQDASNLEYEITSRILKVVSNKSKTVGFILPEDKDLDTDYSTLKREVEKEYQIKKIEPGKDIKDIDVLVVVDGYNLGLDSLAKIDDYINSGGKAIFLEDGVVIDKYLHASSNQAKILKMLKRYGIFVTRDLVLDISNEIAPFARGMIRFLVKYPFWVKITRQGFNHKLPPVSRLESLVLPWPSSLEPDTTLKDVKFEVLAKTTPYAWDQKLFFYLNPSSIPNPRKNERKQFILAVLASGSFKRFTGDTWFFPQGSL
jgi:ABC-type uncharacterized transport system involved in gliding motility auxiliary subunit